MTPAAIFMIVLSVLVILVVIAGVKSVPQGYEWTVERFGRYTRTLRPGLNIILPFLDRVGYKISVMETVLDVPSQEVITKDNAMVAVDGVVFFQVLDSSKAAYEVNNLSNAILNLVMTNIRTVMGSMDLDELLSQRDTINTQLMIVIDEATSPWGVKITRIEIKDITPPRDLVDAMARQMKAERDKRAQILDAEGDRQAAVLKAEGMKQAAVLEAEGRREAAFRDAEAREREAEAEAHAVNALGQSAAGSHPQAITYFIAQKYISALAEIGSGNNNKTIFMPYEATGLLSTLGGLAQLGGDMVKSSGVDMPASMPEPLTAGAKMPPVPPDFPNDLSTE